MTLSDLVMVIFIAQNSCLAYFFILLYISVEKYGQMADLSAVTVMAGLLPEQTHQKQEVPTQQ